MYYPVEQSSSIHQQTFAFLTVKEEANCLYINLNRPEKKNALHPIMVNEIAYALSYAHNEASIWAVVLGAKGSVFCAGADLKAFAGGAKDSPSSIPPPPEEVVIGNLFKHLHKPCIARVHANVYAGGMLLIGGCTHVVAVKSASYSLPEVKRGLWPMQVMQSLLEIMPKRIVVDWCMRAKSLDAEAALKYGLVTELVDSVEELATEVNTIVNEIKKYSPAAVRLGLQACDELAGVADAEAHGYLKMMLMKTLQTEDAMEGIKAFQEKRAPVWKGK